MPCFINSKAANALHQYKFAGSTVHILVLITEGLCNWSKNIYKTRYEH